MVKKSFSSRVFHVENSCDLDVAHGNVIEACSGIADAVGVTALQITVPNVVRSWPLVDLGELVSWP